MTAGPLSQVRISIIGLGLMGGSLALALRGKCAKIIGVDLDEGTRDLAVKRGAVDIARRNLDEVLPRTDLLVLATPVRAILHLLNQLHRVPTVSTPPLGILDLGSTKTEITRSMEKLPVHFDPLGGHPMCGKEMAGLEHAEASLFSGTTFALTPLERTSDGIMRLVRELVTEIGARELILDPIRHDKYTAMTSHMPYLAACSLISAVNNISDGDDTVWELAASGLRDMTRLAASDATVMMDILSTNREAVRAALDQTRAALDHMETLLLDDREELKSVLTELRVERLRRFP